MEGRVSQTVLRIHILNRTRIVSAWKFKHSREIFLLTDYITITLFIQLTGQNALILAGIVEAGNISYNAKGSL